MVQQALVDGVVQQVVRCPASTDARVIVNRVRGVVVTGEEGCNAVASAHWPGEQKERSLATQGSARGRHKMGRSSDGVVCDSVSPS
eukprot:1898040-Pleurochrysis_carterae.AAC.2